MSQNTIEIIKEYKQANKTSFIWSRDAIIFKIKQHELAKRADLSKLLDKFILTKTVREFNKVWDEFGFWCEDNDVNLVLES